MVYMTVAPEPLPDSVQGDEEHKEKEEVQAGSSRRATDQAASSAMATAQKRGAHLRKEKRNNSDYVSPGKKEYVPTGKPRGRKPTGYVAKPYVPKKGSKKNKQNVAPEPTPDSVQEDEEHKEKGELQARSGIGEDEPKGVD